jgi:hypothetical protein
LINILIAIIYMNNIIIHDEPKQRLKKRQLASSLRRGKGAGGAGCTIEARTWRVIECQR